MEQSEKVKETKKYIYVIKLTMNLKQIAYMPYWHMGWLKTLANQKKKMLKANTKI